MYVGVPLFINHAPFSLLSNSSSMYDTHLFLKSEGISFHWKMLLIRDNSLGYSCLCHLCSDLSLCL